MLAVTDIKEKMKKEYPLKPIYLEYALVHDKSWHLFYSEPPTTGIITGIFTTTQVQIHAVRQWHNAKSVFASGPIFSVKSSIPIGKHVELTEGIELINAAVGTPATGRVLGGHGETALLLLSDGGAPIPNYTVVVLLAVKTDGTEDLNVLPPTQSGWKDDIKKACGECWCNHYWCSWFK